MNKQNNRSICFEAQLRAAISENSNNNLILTGYAAKFNSETQIYTDYFEKIEPGAFSKTLNDQDDVRALFNHDENYVLGRTKSGTLTLEEDEIGLKFSLTMPDTQFAKDLYKQIERGDISQCSFGFYIRDSKEEFVNNTILSTLRDVKLFDISIVTYPAYEDTVVEVKKRSINFQEKFINKSEETNETEDLNLDLYAIKHKLRSI